MRIRPTGYELLATARTVLRECLLPQADDDDRQALCAIARTMAIAGHELEFEQPARRDDVEMLEAARALLREKLLGRLPESRRYDTRLVAKAIAVATAELADGEAFARAELAGLAALLGEPPKAARTPHDVHAQAVPLSARLCAQIRAGDFDPGSPRYAATYAHLREATRQALLVSHPAYLEAHAGPARKERKAI